MMRNLLPTQILGTVCKARIFLSLLILVLVAFSLKAQVGVGTTTPHSSAQLDVSANDKGILIPRLTAAERAGMTGELADGLMVYQTDGESGFWYYSSSSESWLRMANMNNIPSSYGGAIIPFSSGIPAVMTTLPGGLIGTVTLLGHGNASTGVSLIGNVIDLSGGPGVLLNHAFSVPRDGVITSLSGYFSSVLSTSLVGTSITINCQLYQSTTDNYFMPIPGASVALGPDLTGILAAGVTSSGEKGGLSIPVTAGTRLLMVVSTTINGMPVITTITGYVSAGVNIL